MLKKIIKKILLRTKRPNPADVHAISNYQIGNHSIDNGIKVQIRQNFNSTENRDVFTQKKLIIGDNSIVSGNFFFENDRGKIMIGDRSFIGSGDYICIDRIEIGNDVLISWGCTIMDNNAHSLKFEERKNDVFEWKKGIEENRIGYYKNWENVTHKPIIIKDKAWIGFKCIILKGVTIGEGAVVGSGSVVTRDIPDWTVAAGNPAKFIKSLK
jgi:acetyltransferase-like isoleucine patch superfamily enzyme